MTKQRMAMRSNFPWSDFKKLGTGELSSSSSTSTALSTKNVEKRAHPRHPFNKPRIQCNGCWGHLFNKHIHMMQCNGCWGIHLTSIGFSALVVGGIFLTSI